MMRVSSSREASPSEQRDEDPITFSEGELIESFFVNERYSTRPKRGRLQHLRTKLVPIYILSHAVMFVTVVSCSTVTTPWKLFDNEEAKKGLIIMCLAVGLYIFLLTSDPGLIRPKREHSRGDPGVSGVVISDHISDPKIVKSSCRVCVTRQPMRTKHCNNCNRCIYTFDHHCWWINNCVGGKNKPAFMLFLLTQAMLSFQTARFCFLSVSTSFRLDTAVNSLLLLLSFLAGCSVTKLLFFHLKLIFVNKTSLEKLRPDQCLYLHSSTTLPLCCQQRHSFFDKGWFRNLKDFFFTKPIEWSVVNAMQNTGKGCGSKCKRFDDYP